MKLQHLTIIFIIIMLPIMLILSNYIQTQIDIAVLRDNYTKSLIDSTHDAMVAYELNSMNNNYNQDANSKKRDVQASINTFFTSMSNNLGVPGYIKKYVEPYIPAIVFTGYDGYYIYAKTKEIPRYTKQEEKADTTGTISEGDIKDGEEITEYNLKPYIYYSAEYKNVNIDVVINYTLDNYVTIYGTVNGVYISQSGYLIDNKINNTLNETLQENIVAKVKNSSGDTFYNKDNCIYYYTYSPRNKTMQKIYNTDYGYCYISESGYLIQANDCTEVNSIGDIDFSDISKTYILKNNYIITELYNKDFDFSEDIKAKLGSLKVNDMVVNTKNGRKRVAELTEEDENNAYYYLKNNNNIIFDGNKEKETSNFNEHRKEVIKLSIQENLKSALANYQSDGTITYKLPKLTDTDWESIFSNVSMITFIQDLPILNGTYNNYVIATSTGNKEYVPDDGIYFIDSNNTYHRITCDQIQGNVIGYKALEFERNKVSIDGDTRNYYPHDAKACYKCIVSSNYPSLYDSSGNLNVSDQNLKNAYYAALARERVTFYKSTSFLK